MIIANMQPELTCRLVTVWGARDFGPDRYGPAQVAVRHEPIVGWEVNVYEGEVWPVTPTGVSRHVQDEHGIKLPVVEWGDGNFFLDEEWSESPCRGMSVETLARECARRFLPPDVVDRLRVVVSGTFGTLLADIPPGVDRITDPKLFVCLPRGSDPAGNLVIDAKHRFGEKHPDA